MSDHKCICGNVEKIEWGIQGFNLIEAEISYNCAKCKRRGSFRIVFPKKKGDEPEIIEEDTNYIG